MPTREASQAEGSLAFCRLLGWGQGAGGEGEGWSWGVRAGSLTLASPSTCPLLFCQQPRNLSQVTSASDTFQAPGNGQGGTAPFHLVSRLW